MEWNNLDGIIPEKLSKAELVSYISSWYDYSLMSDCLTYLIEIDANSAIDKLEKEMTTNVESEKYGDDFYQSTYISSLFYLSPQKAIDYSLVNYDKVKPIVLESIVNSIQNEPIYETLKNKLIDFLINNESVFKSLDVEINGKVYKNTTREDFLESFK